MNRNSLTTSSIKIIVVIAFAGCMSSTFANELKTDQLPPEIVPTDYVLELQPDIQALTFRGRVQITLNVSSPMPHIVLNAKGLEFDKVVLDDHETGAVSIDNQLERASLTFPTGVSSGTHKLIIDYRGNIGRNTFGFFAMDYKADDGLKRMVTTNFEPAGERQFMPSWDEPGRKATFSLTVVVPSNRLAFSNMPVESTQSLSPGLNRVHFAKTPKMSTYLLFLAIGDFERVSNKVGATEVGVVVRRGDTGKGMLALAEATRLVSYYNDYFDIPYPLPKLDLIAAPGAIKGVAMENWGANLFSQSYLLFDPQTSTEKDRQTVFMVVAHEIAHQWFGDLVTMFWWDNLWLNEGFARWMQTKSAIDLHPEWKTDLQAMNIAESGKRADAEPSTHPVEQPVPSVTTAMQAFDSITYDKGASVVLMIENYLGGDKFRNGIRNYLKSHAYGSATSEDLWMALEHASGKPIRTIANEFTLQSGLPLVNLTINVAPTAAPDSCAQVSGKKTVQLNQTRFISEPVEQTSTNQWTIPLSVQSLGNSPIQLLLPPTAKSCHVSVASLPTIVNAGQSSYLRVRYDKPSYLALTRHFSGLSPIDQIGVLQDAWAIGQSGLIPITVTLNFINAISDHADPLVWSQAISILLTMDSNFAGLPIQKTFRKFARSRLSPLLKIIGWDGASEESPTRTQLRSELLNALSSFDDRKVIDKARRRFADVLTNKSTLGPEARQTAEMIVARHADKLMFDILMKRVQAVVDPLIKHQRLVALAAMNDPSLAGRLMEFMRSADIPSGEQPSLLGLIGQNHPDQTWAFVLAHLDVPELFLDDSARLKIVPTVVDNSVNKLRITELQTYGEHYLPADSRRSVESAVSKIRQNIRMVNIYLTQIGTWLLKAAK